MDFIGFTRFMSFRGFGDFRHFMGFMDFVVFEDFMGFEDFKRVFYKERWNPEFLVCAYSFPRFCRFLWFL
jgi:hypothetical protein